MRVLYFVFGLNLFYVLFTPAMSAANEQPTCPVKQSQEARAVFKKLYENAKYAEAEAYLAAYIDNCSSGLNKTIEPMSLQHWLVSDLMLTQQKTGHFKECITRGLAEIHRWGTDEEDTGHKGSPLAAIKYNLKNCRQGIKPIHGVAFSSVKCPITKFEHAIAIPPEWGFSKQDGLCMYLNPGKQLTDEEFANRPETADASQTAPYLVLIKSDGKKDYMLQKILFTEGNLSKGEGCGVLSVGLGGNSQNKIILLSGLLGYCWPGTGSWAVDAVYKLDSDKTNLINEVVVGIH